MRQGERPEQLQGKPATRSRPRLLPSFYVLLGALITVVLLPSLSVPVGGAVVRFVRETTLAGKMYWV